MPYGEPEMLRNLLPDAIKFNKYTAISLGIIIGARISGSRNKHPLNFKSYDLPMTIWCVCPVFTSLTNGLGLYDGLVGTWDHYLTWGVPYFSGRLYFNTPEKIKDLCIAVIVGGIIYVPLCLFELRMSPQLHRKFYGFFQHSWVQHVRGGGYRPIVFMQHGLMVSLWMANTSILLFWLWKNGIVKHLKGIPVSLFLFATTVVTILCKSINAFFALMIGIGSYFFQRSGTQKIPMRLLVLSVPVYIALRSISFIDAADVVNLVGNVVDNPERLHSLSVRLRQEDLTSQKLMQRPIFGWGGYDRGRPIDPESGRIIRTVDSLWLISASKYGYIGLIAMISAMLIGPWKLLRKKTGGEEKKPTSELVVLSIVVTLFMIDCLLNAMLNPVYIMIAGSILGQYIMIHNEVPNKTKKR